MDDTCAVCAETLAWVAYGPCGHREVCSTCVIRLRFVCGDHRCCLCKSETSSIFVTKALGDYTRIITDFSDFPSNPAEGRVGSFWYHEGAQAYFDDLDHYKMTNAMCRLSCTICDGKDEHRSGDSKRRNNVKNVEQLKRHLFDQHSLYMCCLCLDSRKIFICEQKLYTKAQLDQHMRTGDSEVDGGESERGGFAGHPMCEFCQSLFYGDHELYMHMSSEHYTCHICQRQHPGQYNYYRDYDEMEIHFREEHFLCEDEACLAKKFVVFSTESEMKRHNALEHGGRMSRLQRSTALKIPISFHYRHYERDQRLRGRGSSDNLLSSAEAAPIRQESRGVESVTGSFESLSTNNPEPSSRCSLASEQNSSHVSLEESFPPLPVMPRRRNSSYASGISAQNLMAARFRVNVVNTSRQARPVAGRRMNSFAGSSLLLNPPPNSIPLLSSSSPSSSNNRLATDNRCTSQVTISARTLTSIATAPGDSCSSRVSHSSPDTCSSQPIPKVEDAQSANKGLVEKIRDALEFNEEKYSEFKEISSKFRRGLVNTSEYLAYVYQFGLSHLVLELARLCPDAQKQKELVQTYNFNMKSGDPHENGSRNSNGKPRDQKHLKRGKEKCEDDANGSMKAAESCEKAVVEETGASPAKSGKGKSKIQNQQANLSSSNHTELASRNGSVINGSSSKHSSEVKGGGNNPRKKTSKFVRNRLGDALPAARSNEGDSDPGPDKIRENKALNKGPSERLPVRGVWRNGGGQRLLAMNQRAP